MRCSDSGQNLSTDNNYEAAKAQKRIACIGAVPSGKNLEEDGNTRCTIPLMSVQSIRCGKPVVKKIGAPHITLPSSAGRKGYLPMQNFNTEQGLGLSSVACCYTDKEGFIWFGTYGGGVSRFDGKSFTNFSKVQGLSNNTIYCIQEDLNGNIWFGTDGQGVDCYDGKSFKNYSTRQGLTNNTVRSIIKDRKGRLWFGTNKGASMYDGKAFHNVTPAGLLNSAIRAVYEDHKGAIWFGSEGRGLCCYNGRSYTYYNRAEGLSDSTVWSLGEDNAHNLWIGTSNGISCLNGNSITNYLHDGIINNTPVRTISKDQNGRLWFALFGKGVLCYDGEFSNLTKLNSGLGDNKVTSLTIDGGNHIWFGTFGSGVSSFDGGSLSYYTNANGLSGNHIRCILQDRKGDLWFGADRDGLSRFDGNTFFNYFVQDGLPNNNIWCSHEDRKGNLWFGTYGGGLCKYDGKFFSNYSIEQGLASDKILCIVEDQKGNLWFGTDTGGVMCFDGSVFKTYKTTHGLPSNNVWCGMEDKKGNLWFGTFGGGISCFNGHSFTNYTTADGLSDNTILCIAEDKAGNIWFGTDGSGVNRYDGKSFTIYSSAQGLNNNEVYAISINEKGEIVLGTNLGISILTSFVRKEKSTGEFSFSGQVPNGGDTLNEIQVSNTLSNDELQENFNPLFEEYYQKTGYPIKDVNTNAILCDSKGIVWAGCGDGKLVRLDTRISRKRKRFPVSYIQGLKLQDEAISWSTVQAENSRLTRSAKGKKERSTAVAPDGQIATAPEMLEEAVLFEQPLSEQQRLAMAKKYSKLKFDLAPGFSFLPQNLILPCEFNQVTFDYSAIVPSDFPTTHFQYMLKGYDKDWNPVTDKTSATFGNIYEGEYNFILRAQNRFGEWGPPVMYSFKVLPPLYRTWWAFSLYLLFVLMSVGLYIKWRERQLKHEKTVLEENIARQKQIDKERNKLMGDIVRRNKDLEQFSFIVSHNLRAPVANILGVAGLLQNSDIKEADEKYLMNGLINSVNKLDDVIKDLNHMLELRNNTNEKKELVKFSSLLSDIKISIGSALGNKDVNISGDFSEIDEFFTFKSYMYSIFLNLISNSIKYRRPDAEPVIKISSIKQENGIVLVFSDNGLGIDLEMAGKRMFGLYQRFHEHKEGKGVGLYMVKTQVEALGGQISVTSKINAGTVFRLVFEES